MANLKQLSARCMYLMSRDSDLVHLMDRQRPTEKSVTLCGRDCGDKTQWEGLRNGDVQQLSELCPDCLAGFAKLHVVDQRRAALITGLNSHVDHEWKDLVSDLAASGFQVNAQTRRLEFSYAGGVLESGFGFSREEGELDWWLSIIEVERPYRGRGEATRFMEALLAVMERRGETLGLICVPIGNPPPMSQTQLQRWYYRLGFKQSGGDYRMIWSPNAKEDPHYD